MPWRAGANENTTISFTHDVTVEEKKLPAGTYGFHALPSEGDWTLIFSNNSTSWGSFSYKEEEDAVRVTVTPKKADHQEWLIYTFEELTDNSAIVYLSWENLRIHFKIAANVSEIVLADTRNKARTWQDWNNAANYCLQNEVNHEEAMKWNSISIAMNENFRNLQTKSNLLAAVGGAQESKEALDRAIEVADVNELRTYANQLVNQQKVKEGIEMFRLNVERHPDKWFVHNGLAWAYAQAGNTEKAIENYKKALEMNPPQNRQALIKERLEKLVGEGTN